VADVLAAVPALPTYLPSPPRGVWELGPLPLRAYALCIIVGIVVAVVWTERRFTARGGEPGTVTDVAVWAVPFGLIGGRLYHVATDWRTYFGPGGNPIQALYIWQGGLGIWGAVALGGVGAWIACRRRGIPLTAFADAAAPGIVTAQAIGRLGNWFNQELYGAPTSLPWGLEIYRRVDPLTGFPDNLTGVAVDSTPIAIVQPTFLYELLWNLVVAAVVVWADRRFTLARGRAFALYVALYTMGRFVIELLRTDPATRVFGDIRINVVVSVVVFLGAVIYLWRVRGPREVFGRALDRSPDGDAGGAGSASAPGGTPGDMGNREPVDEQDREQRVRNESEALDKEAAPAASSANTGASEASGVDASPTQGAVRSEDDSSAAPPSAAKN
jgi:prolipoprotein diacylglyceryl transferase